VYDSPPAPVDLTQQPLVNPDPPPVAPVRQQERVSSVDVLRGVALLGILLMNVVGFGLPHWAYDDPTVAGGSAGVDFWTWAVNSVLFEGKMRTIFSMLFGAGVILLTSRAEARGGRELVADVYFRRNLWLILFGMIHAYLLLWPGDILYSYGLAGLFLFTLRHVRPRNLIIAGLLLLALQAPKMASFNAMLAQAREGMAGIQRATAAGQPLTAEQKSSKVGWRKMLANARPEPKAVQKEIDDRRKGYLHNVKTFAGIVMLLESSLFYKIFFFDVAGMMLIGMGLMKLGVFSAIRSYKFYALLMLCGYAYGIPAGTWVVYDWVRHGFEPGTRLAVLYDSTRLSVALGHIGLLMIVCKADMLGWLTRRLAAVGQMALTNYVMHTVVCITLFFGFGFGLFGQLRRHQLYYVVAAIWIFQIAASPIWLRHFQFGPLEWVWRSLTYNRRQPMKLRATEPAPAAQVAV
jgi:uncharacterized protein